VASGKINNIFLKDIQWQKAATAAFALDKNEVHVWRISMSENMHRSDALLPVMNLAEAERANRYVFEKDSNLFTISRAAQRIILGGYVDIAPALLEFKFGPDNKPYIGNNNPLNIQYNLSHARNCALLAVSKEIVGCDVEYIDAAFKYGDILPEHFSAEEANYINQQNSTERFFTLWTRKEALLKGTGQGLTDHLKHTAALDGLHLTHPSIADSEYNWQVNSFPVNDDHMGTVATPYDRPELQFWDGGVLQVV
jgi:4'-phosphopantetheinyl transferase